MAFSSKITYIESVMKFPKLTFILAVLVFAVPVFAQTERDIGIELYKAGNFDAAVKSLKKATKTNSSDPITWYFLGVSYLKRDDFKQSIKALGRARDLLPNDLNIRIALGYAYLLANKLFEAQSEALQAIRIDPKNAEATYIAGVVSYRDESYDTAYTYAKKAIELAPGFAYAHLLRSQALVSSFAKQRNTVVKPPEEKYKLLEEASESLTKYLDLATPGKDMDFYRGYLESIKFFSDYYNHTRAEIADAEAKSPGDTTKLRIITKPRAAYTDSARQAGVSGYVDLLVGFSANGTITHILIVKSLSHGLSEAAVRAARQVKFEPRTINGKPVSTAATIRYSFSIY